MTDNRTRTPAGDEAWREKSSPPRADEDDRPLVDAVSASAEPDEESVGSYGQGLGVSSEPGGGEGGVAPPGRRPPLLPDTNESVVEEAEHGAAAEEEIEAAADSSRQSEAERRATAEPDEER